MTTVQLPADLRDRVHQPWCHDHSWDRESVVDLEAYLDGPIVGWGYCSSGDLFRVGQVILDVNDGGMVEGVPSICVDTTELTADQARGLAARLLETADMVDPPDA